MLKLKDDMPVTFSSPFVTSKVASFAFGPLTGQKSNLTRLTLIFLLLFFFLLLPGSPITVANQTSFPLTLFTYLYLAIITIKSSGIRMLYF